jgi:sugar phosphate isomerase/epimerase
MSIKIGIPSLVEFNTIKENFDLAKKLEVDFIELNLNLIYCTPNKKLREAIIDNPFEYTIHYYDDVDISTKSLLKKECLLRDVKEICNLIEGLDVKKIVFHINSGPHVTVGEKKHFVYKDDPDYIIRTLDTLSNVLAILSENKVEMLLENVGIFDHMKPLYEELIRNNYHFVWDVGHDFRYRRQFTNIKNQYNPIISHMHLHDVLCKRDHRLLYSGAIDIDKYKKYAEANNLSVVIEIKDKKNLIESISRFQSFNEEEYIYAWFDKNVDKRIVKDQILDLEREYIYINEECYSQENIDERVEDAIENIASKHNPETFDFSILADYYPDEILKIVDNWNRIKGALLIELHRFITQIIQEKINREVIDRNMKISSVIYSEKDIKEIYHSVYGNDIFRVILMYKELFNFSFSDEVINGLRELNSVVNVLKHGIGRSLYTLQKNYPTTLLKRFSKLDADNPSRQPIFSDMIDFNYATFERYRKIIFAFIDEIPEYTKKVSFNDLIVFLDKLSLERS